MTHRISDLEDLPDAPGGYALMVRLTAPLGLSRRRWRGATLHPGWMDSAPKRGFLRCTPLPPRLDPTDR